MKFSSYLVPASMYQGEAIHSLKAGLEKHGHSLDMRTYNAPPDGDVLVCWGWRRGKQLAAHGRPVLVMERAYVVDRFVWHSFGWNGLNGNAQFHIEDDGGERWNRHFGHELKESRPDGDYVLIMGQVKGDASLFNAPDLNGWYSQQARQISARYNLPVYFRDHPKAKNKWAEHLPRMEGDLDASLSRARCVVAYNSNSIVDARLSGIDIIAGDTGTMAWPVANSPANEIDLKKWTHALAWTQWLLPEIENGDAIPYILKGMTAPKFHELDCSI